MTHERLCGPQGQPCPTPWLCGVDCNFQTAEVETPHDKAARHFWDASPHGYYELLDAPGNAWDRAGFIKRCAVVLVAVIACLLVAVLVVPR